MTGIEGTFQHFELFERQSRQQFLRHRLVLTREAEISDITPAAVIEEILETVEVP